MRDLILPVAVAVLFVWNVALTAKFIEFRDWAEKKLTNRS